MVFFNIDSQRAFIHEPPKYCRCAARQAYTDSRMAAIFHPRERPLSALPNGWFGSVRLIHEGRALIVHERPLAKVGKAISSSRTI